MDPSLMSTDAIMFGIMLPIIIFGFMLFWYK